MSNEETMLELIGKKDALIFKLKEENEELKKKLHFKNLYKLSGKCFFDAANQCNYFDDFVKARQTLEEIKKIAKDNINCESEKLPCPQSQDILNKINEALND